MDQDNNVQAAIEAGKLVADLKTRITEVAGIPVCMIPAGTGMTVLDKVLDLADERAPNPRRREGTTTLSELESFIAHINRYKDSGSIVFADILNMQLTAIYDYNPADVQADAVKSLPRWGVHRSVYASPLSRQWKFWAAMENKPLTQDQFGELIELNMSDLASPPEGFDAPPPAKILEVARTLIVRQKGEFSRSINPTTGEFTLINKNENEESSTRIPRCFLLQLPVYEAGALWQVEARLRFSMQNGRPSFAFVLFEKDRILRDAFNEVREKTAKATGVPILAGTP